MDEWKKLILTKRALKFTHEPDCRPTEEACRGAMFMSTPALSPEALVAMHRAKKKCGPGDNLEKIYVEELASIKSSQTK